jgi:hypothetical protein
MLLYHVDVICKGILIIPLIIFACAAYTYVVNVHRKADDPKKRDYHPFAIILAPFTFIFFLSLGVLVLIFRALLFGAFLIVFTILLIALRKPFLFEWWHKFATKVGDPLLKVNTRLIKLAFSS